MGFRVGAEISLDTTLSAGFGTAVALGVSGLLSAYISEAAERRQELDGLREAMVDPLDDSAHEQAARLAPVVVALVNGLSPFLIAQLILIPLWLASGIAAPDLSHRFGDGDRPGFGFPARGLPRSDPSRFLALGGIAGLALSLVTVGLIISFSP